ncbi:SHOCT domain-containing protein [Clostridium coskatii]|uniref:Tumor necrosis factor receptor superfamily member 19 n=1 Tax=Clostridium coskatii TaxID=1705578 RepID=A0A166UFF2_9CLOT|nr:SHOCT domain-containing protein [Clostridium coskatii]OAA94874.1 tumor necrosis factor receptor superfamily member 19 [Clostridium coskatii]OBR93768.1 tumor necrosis factor receptor superfamily member 19 [Clostridium coskatii]
MMHGYWGWGMMPMMIVCFLLIIAILVFFIISFNGRKDYRHDRKPIEILNEKLASGEISEEEYKRKRQILTEKYDIDK